MIDWWRTYDVLVYIIFILLILVNAFLSCSCLLNNIFVCFDRVRCTSNQSDWLTDWVIRLDMKRRLALTSMDHNHWNGVRFLIRKNTMIIVIGMPHLGVCHQACMSLGLFGAVTYWSSDEVFQEYVTRLVCHPGVHHFFSTPFLTWL